MEVRIVPMTDVELKNFKELAEKLSKLMRASVFHVGQKVRIRSDSIYSKQCTATGFITQISKEIHSEHAAEVSFDDGYRNNYRIGTNGTSMIDLEPVED